ncbi:YkyB family protein [Bacillus marinisedimentorum]|uniref:YkyB family protein n=1 Tax=Bacillus marinisedimentorum TaxID=1821260 RepID=UPI0008721B78|nr:YkyB family protein [Bacillus marinisedimentorum]
MQSHQSGRSKKQQNELPPANPDNLAKAVYTVNRHAKTAPNPKFLYSLKKKSLQKLLKEGKARKIGLHFSPNPKYSQQQSDLLVSVGEYYFHMPPVKEDFQTLEHLGKTSQSYRNPKAQMPLNQAKKLLERYTGYKEKDETHPPKQKKYEKPVFKRLGESYR